MTRATRRKTPATLLAFMLVLTIWPPELVMSSLASQEAAPELIEIASGPIGEPTMQIVGRAIHQSEAITLFGYLTSAIGLDPALLYPDAAAAPDTARFTFTAELAISSETARADVTEFDATGVLRVHLNENAGTSWDDSASFASGQPVAEFSIRLRETLQRQAPGVGIMVGDAQLTQETAGEFALDGQQYRFGSVGIEQRLRFVGAPIEGQEQALVINLTGGVSVASRESNSVVLGAPATPASTGS